MELLKPASLLMPSFARVSGFSRNRLAVGHVPPGGLCVLVYFLGSRMNRLAAEGGPPGDATCIFPFSCFGWFVSDAVVFGLYFYCTYLIGMMNYGIVVTKLIGHCMNLRMELGVRVYAGIGDNKHEIFQ